MEQRQEPSGGCSNCGSDFGLSFNGGWWCVICLEEEEAKQEPVEANGT